MSKSSRKTFLKQSALLAASPLIPFESIAIKNVSGDIPKKLPVVISTWQHGMAANDEAWRYLSNGKDVLSAVEEGVKIPEADPEVTSVGFGGYPDELGKVSLDACIMDWNGNCGAVSFLEHIKHPISVARRVMEDTPHVMLSGHGALEFAVSKGFKKEILTTEKSIEAYEIWKKNKSLPENSPNDSINHDTIGMLAIDENGKIAGACTTSGLAWKMHGRVGDSPIIGAGLFIDGKVGGATATGKGEAVIKIAGSAIIVELMRMGKHPQEACEIAVKRIAEKQADHKNFQVGFLAVNLSGEYGAYSLQKGFEFALNNTGKNQLLQAGHFLP